MRHVIQFANYSPAADIVVTAICFVMIILVACSYISRKRDSKLFLTMVGLVLVSAWVNMVFYTLASMPEHQLEANWLRCFFHALLFLIFVYYIAYICEATNYEKQKLYLYLANSILIIIIGADIFTTAQGPTFTVDETGVNFTGRGLFFYGYAAFLILCVVLMAKVRKLVYSRVMFGFYGTMAVSFLVLLMQGLSGQSSFTVSSFLFPVIAMMYFMHSNPYNVALGALDVRAMEDMVSSMYKDGEEFVFMSLQLPEYDVEGKELPDEIQPLVREFSGKYFRRSMLFQTSNGTLLLIIPSKHNPEMDQRVNRILASFDEQYTRFNIPYKIVAGRSIDDISRKNEYASLIRSILHDMPESTIHRVIPDDIERFNRDEYILLELMDIYNRHDLDDPRVLAYCQPVFNLQTGRFDSAEALMRLDLEKTGIVMPDQFIPMAESHGYIHVLTEIILHKTCREIKHLTDDGFNIGRISVNVSVLELKDEEFCGDINRVIADSNVDGEKVAIELTESQSEADFVIMKEKIEELRRQGIRFYLDDFGTGYSNMERIMELPFDIIKFDRTLVIASGSDERSEKMVENLANMFREMDYSVLYEGVETDADEERCREMFASYLQGYKYSRPVPIEQLQEFLQKADPGMRA